MLTKLAILVIAGLAGSAADGHLRPGLAGAAGTPVSGFRIGDVHYDLASAGISRVTFALDRPAARVRAALPRGQWVDCAPTGGDRFACVPAAPVPVAVLTELSVSAVG